MEPPPSPRDATAAEPTVSIAPSARWMQVCVPGLYAWAVTVAPPAFAGGGRSVSWGAALAGVGAAAALVASVPATLRWGVRARDACLWGFVVGCAATWSLDPGALTPRHFDWTRGAAGVLGWGLFALAWAGPPLDPAASPAPAPAGDGKLSARRRLPRGDAVYLMLGLLAAGALQCIGWEVSPPERALLVRSVSLACGVALLGAAAEVAAARLGAPVATRGRWPAHGQVRRAVAWGVVLLVLVLVGVLTGRRG